jgi:transcriptional regulator with XRE-family HTH domain
MRPRVSNNLRSAARDAGLSLLEIARETGVSYSMLRRIAAGSGDVCLGDAIAVAAAVGRHVERLFELRHERPGSWTSPACHVDLVLVSAVSAEGEATS